MFGTVKNSTRLKERKECWKSKMSVVILLVTGEFHSEWGADCDWGHRRQDGIGASWAPVHHAVSGRSDVGGLHWDIVGWVSVFIFAPSRRLTSVCCCVCVYVICLCLKLEPRGELCVLRWSRRPSCCSVNSFLSSCSVPPSPAPSACLVFG